jgi:cytoskeletal protein CcmA (bactofilin family)
VPEPPKQSVLSTIGEDLVITGIVKSGKDIQLDGQLYGDIHCVSLVLGENSRLEGGVVAEDVVIRGRVKGSVRALRVTLQSKCHVEGDLIHQSLVIEQGAFFEGKSRREENPLTGREQDQVKENLGTKRPDEKEDQSPARFRRSL